MNATIAYDSGGVAAQPATLETGVAASLGSFGFRSYLDSKNLFLQQQQRYFLASFCIAV